MSLLDLCALLPFFTHPSTNFILLNKFYTKLPIPFTSNVILYLLMKDQTNTYNFKRYNNERSKTYKIFLMKFTKNI